MNLFSGIYGLFSKDFRRAFRNILCRCKFREETVSSLIRQIHMPTFFEDMPEDMTKPDSQEDWDLKHSSKQSIVRNVWNTTLVIQHYPYTSRKCLKAIDIKYEKKIVKIWLQLNGEKKIIHNNWKVILKALEPLTIQLEKLWPRLDSEVQWKLLSLLSHYCHNWMSWQK